MLTINKRGLARIVAPIIEPLTLAETKLYLRVDGSAEDTLITDLISVAREHAESYLKRSLLTQTWRMVLEDYAPEALRLPMVPLQEISEIRLVAQDGTSSVFSDTLYTIDAVNEGIRFLTTPYSSSIEIDYVAGFENAADIPKAIRYGLLSHIAYLFDNRGETSAALPQDSILLYQPHREVML